MPTGSMSRPRHERRCRRWTAHGVLPAWAFAWVALGAPATAAYWTQLSSGMPFSDVGLFQLSADGKWAVYAHDAEVDGTVELWSAPSYGGMPRRISGVFPPGQSLHSFAIHPDSSRVVYLAPQDAASVYELYVVPIAGGTPLKLNGALVAGGDVMEFALAASGGTVVYRADQEVDDRFELYSVSISGGVATKINNALVTGGDVTSFRVVPLSSHVIYRADQQTDEVYQIYRGSLGGGGAVRVNGPLTAGGDVHSFAVSDTGIHVVYLADQDTDAVNELYAIPVAGAGGTPWKVNDALVAGGNVVDFRISPDHQRVVYRADQQVDGVFELYSAPPQGGGATKLNGALVTGGDVAFDYAISADSQRVVYRADQQVDEVWELHSAPITGGAAVKLNPALVAGGDVTAFAISPANDWVVYVADQIVDEYPMGFRVPLVGPSASASTIWLRALAIAWRIDAPRGRVVLLGNEAFVDHVVRPWSFPLTGTPDPNGGQQLVPRAAFDPNGDADAFLVGADATILYRADQTTDGKWDLYAIPMYVFWDDFETGDTTAWSVAP